MKKTLIVFLALLVVPGTLWAMDINQGKFELSGTTAFNFSDTTTEVDGESGHRRYHLESRTRRELLLREESRRWV